MPAPPTPAELRAAREGLPQPAPARPTPAPAPAAPAPSAPTSAEQDAATARIVREIQRSTEALRTELQEINTNVRPILKLYQLIMRFIFFTAICAVLPIVIAIVISIFD
jgi:hypothetical protein